MLRLFITILCFLSASIVFCMELTGSSSVNNNYKQALQKADELYDAGDKESAKKLYLAAATEESAEAHFCFCI